MLKIWYGATGLRAGSGPTVSGFRFPGSAKTPVSGFGFPVSGTSKAGEAAVSGFRDFNFTSDGLRLGGFLVFWFFGFFVHCRRRFVENSCYAFYDVVHVGE